MTRTRFRVGPISLMLVPLSLFFPTLLPAQSPNPATLTVRVVNARNANGVVRIALFQSADGFPGNASEALHTQSEKIDPQTLTAEAVFSGIPTGTYAVMVFHDENGNGKLDKNMLGIPREGYGASNNSAKKMRAPTFDEAKFSLSSDQTIEIRLLY
ncbi:MAG TPA: DUF2141 domain-containing protein [Acidobacteriaceae bacterium]|nr:DUF2141 domain-containing protein [Acidobacteriaceae bacterium]